MNQLCKQSMRFTLLSFFCFALIACASQSPPTPTTSPTAAPIETPAAPTETAVIAATAPVAASATPYQPPQHRLAIRQVDGAAEFYDRQTNEAFIPRGVNYVFVPHNGTMSNLPLKVGVYDPARTREDFQKLAGLGFNTVIRLLVAQWPAGETVHRILGRSPTGDLVELHRFQQITQQGDWLTFLPEEPPENIQFVRIETVTSPSWVSWGEIQVFGKPAP